MKPPLPSSKTSLVMRSNVSFLPALVYQKVDDMGEIISAGDSAMQCQMVVDKRKIAENDNACPFQARCWAMSLERRLGSLGPYRGRHSVRLASQSSDNFPLLAVEGLQVWCLLDPTLARLVPPN
ncbi:hypothetical protein V6N11_065617 [Hibiscus sabdariffa]|uniref:Uncharacterized protein n=1 Tax=Hibiscus sabdariffa TaxID=183260 RepID=A0ABR2PI00_9ROSI